MHRSSVTKYSTAIAATAVMLSACSPSQPHAPEATVEQIRPIVVALLDSKSSIQDGRQQYCAGYDRKPEDLSYLPKSRPAAVKKVDIQSQTNDYLVAVAEMQQVDPPQPGTYESQIRLRYKDERWCYDG